MTDIDRTITPRADAPREAPEWLRARRRQHRSATDWLLVRIERRLARLVSRIFGVGDRITTQTLRHELWSEAEREVQVLGQRHYAPNRLCAYVNPNDTVDLRQFDQVIGKHLAELYLEYARSRRWLLAGPVSVLVTDDDEVARGQVDAYAWSDDYQPTVIPQPPLLTLNVTRSGRAYASHPLTAAETRLGTTKDNDFCLALPEFALSQGGFYVSRHHAVIRKDGEGAFTLFDGDGVHPSTNGTWAEARRLEAGKGVQLRAGLHLALGGSARNGQPSPGCLVIEVTKGAPSEGRGHAAAGSTT